MGFFEIILLTAFYGYNSIDLKDTNSYWQAIEGKEVKIERLHSIISDEKLDLTGLEEALANLGHAKSKERRAAYNRVLKFGNEALPGLKEKINSDDPEFIFY